MEQRIRAIINADNHLFYQEYFANKWGYWNKLCVAMDVIGDTSLAMDWYLVNGVGKTDGEKYISIYGVLQAVYLQQDAVKGLSDVINVVAGENGLSVQKMDGYKKDNWERIRNYRNLSIGHPIECSSHEKGEINRVFVSRVTISDKGFQLLLNRDAQKSSRFEYVDIIGLIADYKKEAEVILKDLESTLVEASEIIKKRLSKNA